MVAKAGSLRAAADQWHVSQPTLSEQVRLLEDALGTALFRRTGRQLLLTEEGRRAYDYAEEIFALGRELRDTLSSAPADRPLRMAIGTADCLPKLVAWDLLEPAFHVGQPVHVVCRDGSTAELLDQLTAYRLDVVLTDEPAPSHLPVRVFSQPMITSTVTFCATRALQKTLAGAFPQCLNGRPMLLPSHGTALRTALDRWFYENGLTPKIAAEFDDSALLKTAALAGLGIMPIPSAVSEEALDRYAFAMVGEAAGCTVTYYALTVPTRLRHPGVARILAAASPDEKKAAPPAKPARGPRKSNR